MKNFSIFKQSLNNIKHVSKDTLLNSFYLDELLDNKSSSLIHILQKNSKANLPILRALMPFLNICPEKCNVFKPPNMKNNTVVVMAQHGILNLKRYGL